MTVGDPVMTVNVTARLGFRLAPGWWLGELAMEAAGMDSGLRRNDGWGAGMTVGGDGDGAGRHRFRLSPE